MPVMKTQKYASINGLRAISIFLVLTHHCILQYNVFGNFAHIKWLQPFIKLLNDGQLGVNVFFVISGFLITSLMLQEEAKTKTVSLKNFYIRRTLRIFPAYYFLLLIQSTLTGVRTGTPAMRGLLALRSIFIFYGRLFFLQGIR